MLSYPTPPSLASSAALSKFHPSPAFLPRWRVAGVTALSVLALAGSMCEAQLKTKVSIDTNAKVSMMFSSSLGVAPDSFDGNATAAATLNALRDAGIGIMRYPGNGGMADLYHWSTGTVSNQYTSGKPSYLPPSNNFAASSGGLESLGAALVTVNYGSNLDGTGGGEANEAAAWVAYANGDPGSAQVIGPDSKGHDWKTVGYWASLRAASPVTPDDGLNFLRIGHSSPMNVQFWTIGEEVWNNGFYPDHSDEPDLHGGPLASKADLWKHAGDQRYGPTTYGNAVAAYVKAMKAVDPKIFIGAWLVAPPPDGNTKLGKNWNGEVLKAACASMDFAAVSMTEGGPAMPPLWKDMDENDLLNVSVIRDYAALAHDLVDKYKKFCPAGHAPQLAVVNFGMATWNHMVRPVAAALFAGDAFSFLIEQGVYTTQWGPVHSQLLLDDNNKPKAAYYGLQMIHTMASSPGDIFLSAKSGLADVGAHAVKRRDGGLGILLVNKNWQQSATVTVSIDGYAYKKTGTRYDYNSALLSADKPPASSPMDNLGSTFTVQLPAYSMTALVIPKAD